MVLRAQYFHMVLFIMLYKLILTCKFVDEASVCSHSMESYWAVLLCGTDNYSVHIGTTLMKASFEASDE